VSSASPAAASFFLRVLAHRRQQPVARLTFPGLDHHQRLVAGGDSVDRARRRYRGSARRRPRPRPPPLAKDRGECRQSAEQGPLPAERGGRSSSPWRRAGVVPREDVAAATGEQPESVVQARRHLLRPQHPQPGGREFQGQRDPSSRRQIRATATVLSAFRRKSGSTVRARSQKRATASPDNSRRVVSSGGRDRTETRQTTSPGTSRGSRLVARIDRSQHGRRRSSHRSAAAATRCSQLSSTRSNRRDLR